MMCAREDRFVPRRLVVASLASGPAGFGRGKL